jgi:hypothetical protein
MWKNYGAISSSAIWGSQGTDNENCYLLECVAAWFGRTVPTFHTNLLPPTSRADEYTLSGQQYEYTHWVDQDRTVARNCYFHPAYLHTKLHYDINVICTAKHSLVYFARTTILSLTMNTDLTIQRHMREVSLESLPTQTLVQQLR